MKKSTLSIVAIIVIIVLAGILWYNRSGSSAPQADMTDASASANGTPAISASETTKVSDKISEYVNDELGFSVKYPSTWEREDNNAGVRFVIPIDKAQVSTVATLQGTIQVLSGTCAFPPVTTVKDRGTITVGTNKLNTISMSNTVQGRDYFDRLYSLQKGPVCYFFHFNSVTQAPSVKNLTGSQATQAQNNNKAIINDADAAFTTMVKTFSFITLPTGVDETKAAPAK
jgi:hypothetical protein